MDFHFRAPSEGLAQLELEAKLHEYAALTLQGHRLELYSKPDLMYFAGFLRGPIHTIQWLEYQGEPTMERFGMPHIPDLQPLRALSLYWDSLNTLVVDTFETSDCIDLQEDREHVRRYDVLRCANLLKFASQSMPLHERDTMTTYRIQSHKDVWIARFMHD